MADLSEFQFGPGSVWAVVTQFMDGTSPSLPQPRKFDVLQSFDVTFKTTVKKLMGATTYARAIGIASGEVSIKINFARFEASIWQFLFGEPAGVTSSGLLMGDDEAHSIPASSSYTVTVTNSANYTKDWGVRFGDTGEPLTSVASVAATGQYSVSAGVYTFDVADASRPVLISYEYTNSTGATLGMLSHPQGQISLTSMRYQGYYNGRLVGLYLPNTVGSSLNVPTKQGDFVIEEMQFDAFANAANQVGYLYMPAAN